MAYTGNKVGDGHNFRMKRDENGEAYASFTDANAERIVGWFKNEDDIRIEEKDGVRWIVGDGTIWSYYARELADLLTEQGAEGMDVSIETLVDNIREENGVEVFDDYQILGTTILGKGVNPAVAGAHIRSLSLEDDLKNFKLRVASYMETSLLVPHDDVGRSQFTAMKHLKAIGQHTLHLFLHPAVKRVVLHCSHHGVRTYPHRDSVSHPLGNNAPIKSQYDVCLVLYLHCCLRL